MSEKKKNIPEAIITNGTIIGDISKAIIGRRNGISLRDKPIAASVPKPVASSVANIPIIKLFFIDLIHCELAQRSVHQPAIANGSIIPLCRISMYHRTENASGSNASIPCVKLK